MSIDTLVEGAPSQAQQTPYHIAYPVQAPSHYGHTHPRYDVDRSYNLLFLGEPVQFGTRGYHGFPESLGGLNYTSLTLKLARNDWPHADPIEVGTHETVHSGPGYHGHDNAERLTRLATADIMNSRKLAGVSRPVYVSQYNFSQN